MSSPLSLPPIAPVHHDDAASNLAFSQPKTTDASPVESRMHSHIGSAVALSFAFDSITKSLNVVMTDKMSGEVVRKISYAHLPTEVHQSNKLHGLLLDQFA
jgi:uncharacterized FlaG/YvyC family protein